LTLFYEHKYNELAVEQ